MRAPKNRDCSHVIGIGASANGIEALSQLVANLRPQSDCIFVIAHHISASNRSLIAEILARQSRLPVQEIVANSIPSPNVIYIVPPGCNLVVEQGCFHLSMQDQDLTPKKPINLLFQSMAHEFEERAIGILLSGTGSDGTRGLQAIKSGGGVTFVQSPESAKYDDIARSAIDAGVADHMGAPAEISLRLANLLRLNTDNPTVDVDAPKSSPAQLADLLDRVRRQTRIDFSSYKVSTVRRRLQRRMVATKSPSLEAYLAYTEAQPAELSVLAKETLISVTAFFRGEQAFDALRPHLREMILHKPPGAALRVWAVGCATGEEAYSLAILCSDLIEEAALDLSLLVFATDIDNEALAVARRGVYSQSAMAGMPEQYLNRYFVPIAGGVEVIQHLRERIIFTRQDVAVDPAFINLDVVSCRNVLIYFNLDLQARVLKTFHRSQNEGGLLFLGCAETVSQQDTSFAVADTHAKIFKRRDEAKAAASTKLVRGKLTRPITAMRPVSTAHEVAFLEALAGRAGPNMLMDGTLRTLHTQAGVTDSGCAPSASREVTDTPLEDILSSTRTHTRNLVEIMGASKEEMEALNDELQAANEELQATNEELLSVNDDSQIKSVELASINSDFESLYNTLDFPVLLFDSQLVLKRANAAAMRSYDLSITSSGQPIVRLYLPVHLQLIEQRMRGVLLSERKESYSVQCDGRTYQIFIAPVISPSASIQGVVLVVIDNTDLTQAQARTLESQQQLLSIMNHAMSLISVKDASGRYEFVNHRFEILFGLSASAVIGKTDHQLFGVQVAHLMRQGDLNVMRQMAAVESTDEVSMEGGTLWLDCIRFPIFDARGHLRSICTQANDVTHRHQADQQLRLAAKVFACSGEAIVITDVNRKIMSVNAAFSRITGYAAEEVLGKTPNLLKSGQTSPALYQAMWCSLAEQGVWQGEIVNRRKNGEIYPEWLIINAVRDDDGQVVNYVALFSDITTLKASQQRIEFLATHDDLTGLPNRSLLIDRLNQALYHANRQSQQIAVLFIDLDNFKNINDTLGHGTGDLLLQQATQRLQQCVRDSDTLARIGGDEFVAVLTNIKIEEVNTVAGRIVDCLAAPFLILDHRLHVSASIGISLFPEDGKDSSNLLKNADTAMYRAKDRGRNQFQFFADEMKIVLLQRMTIETGLRVALDNALLHMVYQPKIDLRTGLVIGAEALLRWCDPILGNVSPAQFIPVAEGCGLIAAVGSRVFDLVLEQIAAWQLQGLNVPRIAINVSAHQLRDADFVANLTARLHANRVPAHGITIEITESALMQKIEVVRDKLVKLESMGTHMSVDDFGTGYSSLAYLRKLPLHELKVDRSFVDGIADEPDDRSITKSIIDMAHALGLRVVAEGVETQAQFEILLQDGCDVVQGYLLYRPLTADDFEQILQANCKIRRDIPLLPWVTTTVH